MSNYINIQTVGSDILTSPELEELVTKALRHYPMGRKWFEEHYSSGDILSRGRIGIVVYENHITPVGLALLKRTPDENKICNLCCPAKHLPALIKQCLSHFNDGDVINITIPEEANGKLSHLLIDVGFVYQRTVVGEYREGKIEFHYSRLPT